MTIYSRRTFAVNNPSQNHEAPIPHIDKRLFDWPGKPVWKFLTDYWSQFPSLRVHTGLHKIFYGQPEEWVGNPFSKQFS